VWKRRRTMNSLLPCPKTSVGTACMTLSTRATGELACATRYCFMCGMDGVVLIVAERSPDTSKIKQKMLYAASKDALRKKVSLLN
jgi:hypothetical protein